MSPNTPSKYKLIGFPLNAPIVSFIHERLFQLSRRNSIYGLYEMSQQDFNESINDLLSEDGLNVDAPYKQEIIRYLDQVDEKSELYNAVNTVSCKSEKSGHNTESYGFLQALHAMGAHLHDQKRILLVGVGEYAKIGAVETILAGRKLTIAARTENLPKAELLRESLMNVNASAHIHIVDVAELSGAYDLILNASPVGMYPHINECPIPRAVIEQANYVFDLICRPTRTQLLEIAQEAGIPCSNGIPMLVWQAVASHCIWYGADFRDEAILALIEETNAMVDNGFSKGPSARACQI